MILDFWATSCAPCIKALPYLEELQAKFPSDLQVITITDESEERLRAFLKKRKTSLPVVIDPERKLAAHFPHRVISHTVVIDKNGIVRAITSPGEINEAIIRKLLANEAIDIPEKRDILDFDTSKPFSGNENATFQLTVLPYQDGLNSKMNDSGGTGEYANRRIYAVNLSPDALFEIAHQYPSGIRTEVEVKDPAAFKSKQNMVCFDLIVPEHKGAQRFEIMQQQLDMALDYRVKIEERVKPVKVLRLIEGKKAYLPLTKGGESEAGYGGAGLSMTNSQSQIIADFLQAQFEKIVVDETGLKEFYDLELAWHNEAPDQIHQELAKLGLELVDAERKIKMLVISDK